jgi:LPXTG-motif cell wall-anchored protein
MKKLLKRTTAVILTGAVLIFGASGALATDGSVTYNSANNWDTAVTVQSAYGETDLFGETMKNLVPGDEETIELQLQNNYSRRVRFYLQAIPVYEEESASPSGEESTVTSGGDIISGLESIEGREYYNNLLEQLTITVKFNDTVIYTGPLSGSATENGMYTSGVLLGRVSPGNFGDITATLSVPYTLSDDYQNKLCAVQWKFGAVREVIYTSPSPSVSPSESPVVSEEPSPTPSDEIVDEDDTPLTDTGEIDEIDEEDVPGTVIVVEGDPGSLPLTGGIETYALPAGIVLAALIIAFVLVTRKKKSA